MGHEGVCGPINAVYGLIFVIAGFRQSAIAVLKRVTQIAECRRRIFKMAKDGRRQ
jgi:hypothetical protein